MAEERHGAAYSIKSTKKQDPTTHHQRTKVTDLYTYKPVGMDAWDPKPHQPKPGDVVRTISPAKAGVRGLQMPKSQTYVEHAETGAFHGMVNRASLERAGASYTVKASRSHDYSGTGQPPHHSKPMKKG